MAKILIIGVGNSQTEVVKMLHERVPEAKCISMTMQRNPSIPEDEDNIQNYNLIEHSKTAQQIVRLGLMPGDEKYELNKHLSEILREQLSDIERLLG